MPYRVIASKRQIAESLRKAPRWLPTPDVQRMFASRVLGVVGGRLWFWGGARKRLIWLAEDGSMGLGGEIGEDHLFPFPTNAGFVWQGVTAWHHSPDGFQDFSAVAGTLPHGDSCMTRGIVPCGSDRVLMFQYLTGGGEVRVYGSTDDGATWAELFETTGEPIVHFHGGYWDADTSTLYVLTGDAAKASTILLCDDVDDLLLGDGNWTTDWKSVWGLEDSDRTTLDPDYVLNDNLDGTAVGSVPTDQQFRAVDFVVKDGCGYWATDIDTDTIRDERGMYRSNLATKVSEAIGPTGADAPKGVGWGCALAPLPDGDEVVVFNFGSCGKGASEINDYKCRIVAALQDDSDWILLRTVERDTDDYDGHFGLWMWPFAGHLWCRAHVDKIGINKYFVSIVGRIVEADRVYDEISERRWGGLGLPARQAGDVLSRNSQLYPDDAAALGCDPADWTLNDEDTDLSGVVSHSCVVVTTSADKSGTWVVGDNVDEDGGAWTGATIRGINGTSILLQLDASANTGTDVTDAQTLKNTDQGDDTVGVASVEQMQLDGRRYAVRVLPVSGSNTYLRQRMRLYGLAPGWISARLRIYLPDVTPDQSAQLYMGGYGSISFSIPAADYDGQWHDYYNTYFYSMHPEKDTYLTEECWLAAYLNLGDAGTMHPVYISELSCVRGVMPGPRGVWHPSDATWA